MSATSQRRMEIAHAGLLRSRKLLLRNLLNTSKPTEELRGPSRVVLALCRSGWEAERPCVSLGHVAALLCIFVFSPDFCAWTAIHWNIVPYVRFIILRATNMLRVACTCICYTAMPVRNKLPSSMVHPLLTPSATIGTKLYIRSSQTTHVLHMLCKKQNAILHSSPETFLLLPCPSPAASFCCWSITYSTHSLVTSYCLIIVSPVLWGCFITIDPRTLKPIQYYQNTL